MLGMGGDMCIICSKTKTKNKEFWINSFTFFFFFFLKTSSANQPRLEDRHRGGCLLPWEWALGWLGLEKGVIFLLQESKVTSEWPLERGIPALPLPFCPRSQSLTSPYKSTSKQLPTRHRGGPAAEPGNLVQNSGECRPRLGRRKLWCDREGAVSDGHQYHSGMQAHRVTLMYSGDHPEAELIPFSWLLIILVGLSLLRKTQARLACGLLSTQNTAPLPRSFFLFLANTRCSFPFPSPREFHTVRAFSVRISSPGLLFIIWQETSKRVFRETSRMTQLLAFKLSTNSPVSFLKFFFFG